eukprot:TRINITY_DN1744_c0_g1_i16.p1 TRINITY_DN1744_c0_g1~~TRINITY_DN1744_c0_g1_i16.p1  ORF type:complete len:434 (-),score=38.05 TRINITY_DN1744_c0_g1_i16:256-1557(-)
MDFYESLEGMLVTVETPLLVGPNSNRFNESYIVPSEGFGSTGLNQFGGITIDPYIDFNPERLQLEDFEGQSITANMGSVLESVTGIIDYSFGNYELYPIQEVVVAKQSNQKVNAYSRDGDITVATYNIQNYDGSSANLLASDIVNFLDSPDIIALQEVQDEDGQNDSNVTSPNLNMNTLIQAIAKAGGPQKYKFLNIDPEDDADGGIPGGNIRNTFLYNSDNVSLCAAKNMQSANFSTVGSVEIVQGDLKLNFNPVRVNPISEAFVNSRKPLVAQFCMQGTGYSLFLINVHFSSKLGSTGLMGKVQPQVNGGEARRAAQATEVDNFVKQILAQNASANLVVLGDVNEFIPFPTSSPFPDWTTGRGSLNNILPVNEDSWTYIFQGNSQSLDHVFISKSLENQVVSSQTVHINTPFDVSSQTSDHDPIVFGISFD